MKKSLFIVAVVSSLLTAALVWALPAEGIVTNSQNKPGGQTTMRLNTEGSLVTANTSGDFYEATRLNEVYSCKTASAGTSFTTAGTSPLGAAGIAWLAVVNPANSGYNLEVIQSTIVGVSGTPGVGAQVYNLGCSQTVTSATFTAPISHLTGQVGGSVGKCYTQTALTGSTALTEVRVHPYGPFAAAMAATTPGLEAVDIVNGALIVPPGCVLAIQTTAAGTTHIAAGSIDFRQAVP